MRRWFVTLMSLPLITACSHQAPPRAMPRTVETLVLKLRPSVDSEDLAGEIRARVESPLSFQVGGRLLERRVQLGDHVARGEVLATLDSRDLDLAVQSAVAQEQAATAQVELARTDLERVSHLLDQGFVSTAERDHRRVALDAAVAAQKQAQSELALRRDQRNYAQLTAPAAGVITQVSGDVGQVMAAGEPILRLAQDGRREVAVVLPEDRLAHLHQMHAELSLWSDPGQRFAVHLREISAAADPATRTFTARFSIDPGAPALALGQSAVLHLYEHHGGEELAVPTTAIFEHQGQALVWLYDAHLGVVHSHAVQVLGADGNDIVIAGLHAGDIIVAAGTHVLKEGESVVRAPDSERAQGSA